MLIFKTPKKILKQAKENFEEIESLQDLKIPEILPIAKSTLSDL